MANVLRKFQVSFVKSFIKRAVKVLEKSSRKFDFTKKRAEKSDSDAEKTTRSPVG